VGFEGFVGEGYAEGFVVFLLWLLVWSFRDVVLERLESMRTHVWHDGFIDVTARSIGGDGSLRYAGNRRSDGRITSDRRRDSARSESPQHLWGVADAARCRDVQRRFGREWMFVVRWLRSYIGSLGRESPLRTDWVV